MSKFNGVQKLRNECENWIDNLWCTSIGEYVSRLVAYIVKLEKEIASMDAQLRRKNREIAKQKLDSERLNGIIDGQRQIIRYLRGEP